MLSTLVFLCMVLATLVTIVLVIVSILRRRAKQAGKLLAIYGICLAIYLCVVVIVGMLTLQREVKMGENWCFDDWCIAVESVSLTRELGQNTSAVKTDGQFYVVKLKLSNHARGRAQRASSVAVHLIDSQGRWFDISPSGQSAWEAQNGPAAPLTSMLPVGESLVTIQVFDLPNDSRDVSLTVEHPVGWSPSFFIIGDEASLFHKPTIVRLP